MIVLGIIGSFLALAATVRTAANSVGYFWHLTDIHWDPKYETKDNNCIRGGSAVPKGMYGEHRCDSPWALVDSVTQGMLSSHGDDLEFILWTGDGLTNSKGVDKMSHLTNLTHQLSHAFTSHFVFPVLGHDDPDVDLTSEYPYAELSDLWKHWLPTEALVTFKKGGYYTIERKKRKLRLIALNTNLCTGIVEGEDPAGQWAWLEGELAKSKLKNETVYLVGHVAPGVDERVGGPPKPSMAPHHNARYISLVQKYSDIITGQFFGHLHSDTFRVVYNESGHPVSRLFLSPSLTPRRSSAGFNNPGVRLYKIEIDTGQVLDYYQYYLDLTAANQLMTPNWQILYNLTEYYSMQYISPTEFHDLAESFTTAEGVPIFTRYLQANSVYSSSPGPSTNVAGAFSHYCAITRLDYTEYHNCLATAAAPLAATTAAAPVIPSAASTTPTILHVYSVLPALSCLFR